MEVPRAPKNGGEVGENALDHAALANPIRTQERDDETRRGDRPAECPPQFAQGTRGRERRGPAQRSAQAAQLRPDAGPFVVLCCTPDQLDVGRAAPEPLQLAPRTVRVAAPQPGKVLAGLRTEVELVDPLDDVVDELHVRRSNVESLLTCVLVEGALALRENLLGVQQSPSGAPVVAANVDRERAQAA
jgi:hypothetical protein